MSWPRFTAILALSMLVIVGGNVLRYVEAKRDGRLPPQSGVTALSPSGSSPQAVSPASPLQSLSQGEVR